MVTPGFLSSTIKVYGVYIGTDKWATLPMKGSFTITDGLRLAGGKVGG